MYELFERQGTGGDRQICLRQGIILTVISSLIPQITVFNDLLRTSNLRYHPSTLELEDIVDNQFNGRADGTG